MWTFLSDLARKPKTTHTVLVMESEGVEQARQYQIRPQQLGVSWIVSLSVVSLLTALVIAFTPVRQLIPGYGTEAVEQSAHLNAMRVEALRDSLAVQSHYIDRLQRLMTGRVEPSSTSPGETARLAPARPEQPRPQDRRNEGDGDLHRQPALTVTSFPASAGSSGDTARLPDLRLPLTPPVETGFPTRGFDVRKGHYAVDIAVEAGSYVRSVGDGYVILSDWTQEGGYTIAVQHADGYVSVYKHNQRLLKQVGARVRGQESIAISGNTGEITTGPHLHFELWHHGLAQDPRPLLEGW